MSVDRLVTMMNEHHTQVLSGISHMEEAGEAGPVSHPVMSLFYYFDKLLSMKTKSQLSSAGNQLSALE